MTRQEKALLQAVVDTPEDDAPRLVYADWLDEHDQPQRAELIRLQLRLAAVPADDPGRPAARARERELLEAHGKAWLAPVRRWLHEPADFLTPHRSRWQFRRGFLERVTLTVETFREHGHRILAAAPVREAWFPDCDGDDLAALGEVEHLARLGALDLAGATFDDGTNEFLYSPHLAGLRRLDFQCEIHDEGMGGDVWRALLTSESLAGLEELLLTTMPMDAGDFVFLARRFELPSLRRLGLEGVVRIGVDKARPLADSARLGAVEVLAATREHVHPDAQAVLAERFGPGLLLNDRDPYDPLWEPCF